MSLNLNDGKAMKHIYRIPLLLLGVLLSFNSCDSDNDDPIIGPDVPPAEEDSKTPILTSEDGSAIVNTGEIVVGNEETDVVFDMVSTILSPTEGRIEEHTINCVGMAAARLIGEDFKEQDMSSIVKDATIINRGTITVHTKDIVAKYADLVQDPDHKDRKFTYLRVLVMYGGKNNLLVNEGTINVYFDHDPYTKITVYVMAMSGSKESTLVNRGSINFYGNGSVATRMRGMASFGNGMTLINDNTITADVDLAEDSRMITTGGSNMTVVNNGVMNATCSGTLLGMTRFGDNCLINNGSIKLVSKCTPEGYKNITDLPHRCVAGLFDMIETARPAVTSPILNRGDIDITVAGVNPEDSCRKAGGIVIMSTAGKLPFDYHDEVRNEGTIKYHDEGGRGNIAAEGFFCAVSPKFPIYVNVDQWNTTLRDFKKKPLFAIMGCNFNLNVANICLSKADGYKEGTEYSVALGDIIKNGLSPMNNIIGYDNMRFSSADNTLDVLLNKEMETVALVTKSE